MRATATDQHGQRAELSPLALYDLIWELNPISAVPRYVLSSTSSRAILGRVRLFYLSNADGTTRVVSMSSSWRTAIIQQSLS